MSQATTTTSTAPGAPAEHIERPSRARLTRVRRARLEAMVERIIGLLDEWDGDCDAEPEPDEDNGDREWDTSDAEPDADDLAVPPVFLYERHRVVAAVRLTTEDKGVA